MTQSFDSMSADERQEVINSHMPIVFGIAKRYALRSLRNRGIEYPDLIQEGALALVTAMNRYREGTGASFRTYAYTRVSGAMIDYVRRHNLSPRGTMRRRDKLESITKQFAEIHHRQPTNEELCTELGCKIWQLRTMIAGISSMKVPIFLDASKSDMCMSSTGSCSDEVFAGALYQQIASKDENTEDRVIRQDTAQRVREELAKLPENVRLVIYHRYYSNLDYKAISEQLHVPKSRIPLLRKQGEDALRVSLAYERPPNQR